MQRPEFVEFEGITVSAPALLRSQRKQVGPITKSWSRTSFPLPDAYNAPKHVEAWLEENCKGNWSTFNYGNPKAKDYSQIMVVRFEDLNDALFFKLRDGHRSWEGK